MEEEALHIRYLIVVAAVLCALIIGYNAFFVPEVSLPAVSVDASAPSSGSSSSEGAYVPKAPSSGQEFAGSSKGEARGKININTATAAQLSDGLTGIGPVMAKRIVEYREKNGAFKSIEALKNVSGIGDKTFEKLKNDITVDNG